jgi:hypothetical protein
LKIKKKYLCGAVGIKSFIIFSSRYPLQIRRKANAQSFTVFSFLSGSLLAEGIYSASLEAIF